MPIFSIICVLFLLCASTVCGAVVNGTVNIGIILDSTSWVGKVAKTAIQLAADDVNNDPNLFNGGRLVLHLREARTVLEGTSAVVDLLQKEVVTILGPQGSEVAEIISHFGDAARVPIISFSATRISPLLSNNRFPYFVRMARSNTLQMKAVAALVKLHGWKRIVLIYTNDDFGSEALLSLYEALRDVGSEIEYKLPISPTAKKHAIREQLLSLKTTRESSVFVAHMLPDVGSHLFMEAKMVGMMEAGYVWITTDGFTSLWDDVVNASTMGSMQGLVGVKTHIPDSDQLNDFTQRWKRRFRLDNPEVDMNAFLNLYGLLAYDSLRMVAQALRNLGTKTNFSFFRSPNPPPTIGNAEIKVSQQGKRLLWEIHRTKFTGLSGPIQISHGEMKGCTYDIVNVVGKSYQVVGNWTEKIGISMEKYAPVRWPGRPPHAPRGWLIPPSGKRLQIGVPVKRAWTEFVKIKYDAYNRSIITGFCIDIFDAAVKRLDYALPYDLVPYPEDGKSFTKYDDLVKQVENKKFDAVVGDVTILERRSNSVDFTQPFTESGLVMLVPAKRAENKNPWLFFLPFTFRQWCTIAAFVIFTGSVVWLLEHKTNPDFRGRPRTEVVTTLSFALSTMFLAHRERIDSSLARVVIVVWLFVASILSASYTASLSSRLTIQRMEPTIDSVEKVVYRRVPVGYPTGSFIGDYLRDHLNISKENMKNYSTPEQYEDALSKGPDKGGVAAIFLELPIVRLFLSGRCGYKMIDPVYKTGGFGFAFPKGSPLVSDISKAILNLSESAELRKIEHKYFNTSSCSDSDSDMLDVGSFWGLYLITGSVSVVALIIFFSRLLYKFMKDPNAAGDQDGSSSIKSIKSFAKYLDQKEVSPSVFEVKNLSYHPFPSSNVDHESSFCNEEHRGVRVDVMVDAVSIHQHTDDIEGRHAIELDIARTVIVEDRACPTEHQEKKQQQSMEKYTSIENCSQN